MTDPLILRRLVSALARTRPNLGFGGGGQTATPSTFHREARLLPARGPKYKSLQECRPPARPLLSLGRRLLAGQNPALQLRHRLAFLDPHDVADLGHIGLVMRMVVFGAANRLLQQWMGEAALHLDHDRLVVLVGNDDALQDAFWHPILLRP